MNDEVTDINEILNVIDTIQVTLVSKQQFSNQFEKYSFRVRRKSLSEESQRSFLCHEYLVSEREDIKLTK